MMAENSQDRRQSTECWAYLCVLALVHKFINLDEPRKRGGLIRPDFEDLDENPFFNSIYNYYTARPDTLEELCLTEFARDYDIVYDSKDNREANQMYTVADEESGR